MSNSIKIGLLNLRLQFLGQSYPNYLKTLNWGICPNFCITSQVFKQPCYHNKLTPCSRCLGCTFSTPNNADAGNPKQNHKWSQHGRRQKQPNLSSIVPRKNNLLHSPILSLFLCRMEHSISSFLHFLSSFARSTAIKFGSITIPVSAFHTLSTWCVKKIFMSLLVL